MTIKAGDRIPQVTLFLMGEHGTEAVSTDEIFAGKKVVLFGIPGAFTPTCSNAHLPGYVVQADQLLAKGVDSIACLSVNDAFVMDAWGKTQNADRILMLADGSATLTKAMGLELDQTDIGRGIRSQRYAMIVDDGVVTLLNLEAPGKFEVSDSETMLRAL